MKRMFGNRGESEESVELGRLREEVKFLREALAIERHNVKLERDKLDEINKLLMKRLGFIEQEETTEVRDYKPIRPKNPPWGVVRGRIENARKNRKAVSADGGSNEGES